MNKHIKFKGLTVNDKRSMFLNNIAFVIHKAFHPEQSWGEVRNKQPYIKAAEAAIDAIHNQPPSLDGVTIDDWRQK